MRTSLNKVYFWPYAFIKVYNTTMHGALYFVVVNLINEWELKYTINGS